MITTPSGTYTLEELMRIERNLRNNFKMFWNGMISVWELEQAKKDSGLSYGEIKSIQYDASMEVAKEKGEI